MSETARDYTRMLYPFLETEPQQRPSIADVLESVRVSTLQKCEDVVALRRAIQRAHREDIARAGQAVAQAVARGKKILAFGNGGSATDALDVVADCATPPLAEWRPLPAQSLVSDTGVLTAIANDVGFEHVFARQVVAYGERGDVALAFSTSGNSPSIVRGLEEARRRGLLTIAVLGYDGGRVASAVGCDFVFIAPADHLPRIQEGQATVWHALLRVVHEELARA